MPFDQFVKQVLTDAAPEKYPVIIDKDAFAVVALHDDYVDLKYGSVVVNKAVALTRYVRSIRLADIKSIQPMPDWHFVQMPDGLLPSTLSTVMGDEAERKIPGFLQSWNEALQQRDKAGPK